MSSIISTYCFSIGEDSYSTDQEIFHAFTYCFHCYGDYCVMGHETGWNVLMEHNA